MKWFLCVVSVLFPVVALANGIKNNSTSEDVGTLKVFEVADTATWLMIPQNDNWTVDSDGKRLYFASPVKGEFTVICAMKDETNASGVKIHSLTFTNGKKSDDKTDGDDFFALVDDLKSKVGGATNNESNLLAYQFQKTIKSIDDKSLTSCASAKMTVLNLWNTYASKQAVSKWNVFFEGLDSELEKDDLNKLKEQFLVIIAVLSQDWGSKCP